MKTKQHEILQLTSTRWTNSLLLVPKTFKDLCFNICFFLLLFWVQMFYKCPGGLMSVKCYITFFCFLQCAMYKDPFYWVSEGLTQWSAHTGRISVRCDVVFNLYLNGGGKLEDLQLCSIHPRQSINMTNWHLLQYFVCVCFYFSVSDLILEKSSCVHCYIKLTAKQMGRYFVGSCGVNPTYLWSTFSKGDALITKTTCQYWNCPMFLIWICV